MRSVSTLPPALILASAPAMAQAADLGDIASHIPIWVPILLIYVLTMTLRATRERTAGLPRLLAIPVLFVVWGISGLFSRHQVTLPLALDWMVCVAAGGALVWMVGRPIVLGVDRASRQVRLAGSWAPFIRVTLLFAAKFTLGVMMATRPDIAEPLAFADAAVSGISAGYFLFWAIALLSAYAAPVLAHDPAIAE